MNKLLEEAFAEAAKLPDDEQRAIAGLILEELRMERGWDKRFAASQDKLSELSRRAGEHIRRGATLPFDPSDRPEK